MKIFINNNVFYKISKVSTFLVIKVTLIIYRRRSSAHWSKVPSFFMTACRRTHLVIKKKNSACDKYSYSDALINVVFNSNMLSIESLVDFATLSKRSGDYRSIFNMKILLLFYQYCFLPNMNWILAKSVVLCFRWNLIYCWKICDVMKH